MALVPASIRYKNPGAMWGGNPISRKWGELAHVTLNDGLGQGNQIAVFPDFAHGIAAQIDLWRSARYRNKTFKAAITIWSGGNWVSSYISFVKARVPSMTEDTIINDALLRSPTGIAFLKAQAAHEAGRTYPALEADWVQGQKMAFGGALGVPATTSVLNNPKPKTATAIAVGTVASTAVVVKQAASAGHSGWVITGMILAGIVAAGVAVWWFHFRHEHIPTGGGRVMVDDGKGAS